MSDVPAGWYPDPQPVAPGRPSQQRYWDGTAWTAHVAPLEPGPTQPAPYAGSPYGSTPQAYGVPVAATTPDGQRLAGWWQRVGASLIDACIVIPVTVLLSIPFWGRIADVFGDYIDDVQRSVDTGGAAPSSAELQSQLGGTFAVIGLIQLAVLLVYTVGFLMWKQATPGKLALGLRVRLRDRPGPMPLGTVLLRFLGANGGTAFNLIPFVGAIGALYTVLDALWPLWDSRKQALHDKIASTNVVRTR